MKFLAMLMLFLSLVPIGLAQDKKVAAIKFLEISDDDTEIFISGMREFLQKLAASPTTTTGFVAIAQNATERQKIVREMLKRRPALKDRVEYTRAGSAYDKGWFTTEFWFIPKGAEPPYRRLTADCSCPYISVLGKDRVESDRKELTFTANISGGSQDELLTYQWTVVGGDIIKGQGTPSITVVVRNRLEPTVAAKIIVAGIDEDCACPLSASFSTIIVR